MGREGRDGAKEASCSGGRGHGDGGGVGFGRELLVAVNDLVVKGEKGEREGMDGEWRRVVEGSRVGERGALRVDNACIPDRTGKPPLQHMATNERSLLTVTLLSHNLTFPYPSLHPIAARSPLYVGTPRTATTSLSPSSSSRGAGTTTRRQTLSSSSSSARRPRSVPGSTLGLSLSNPYNGSASTYSINIRW